MSFLFKNLPLLLTAVTADRLSGQISQAGPPGLSFLDVNPHTLADPGFMSRPSDAFTMSRLTVSPDS